MPSNLGYFSPTGFLRPLVHTYVFSVYVHCQVYCTLMFSAQFRIFSYTVLFFPFSYPPVI